MELSAERQEEKGMGHGVELRIANLKTSSQESGEMKQRAEFRETGETGPRREREKDLAIAIV